MASTINTYFVLPDLRQFLTDRGVMNDQLSSVFDELAQGPTKLACMIPTKGKGKVKNRRKTSPKTGYNIYQKERHAKVKEEHPEFTSQEVLAYVSSSWKTQSDECKAKYKARATEFNLRAAGIESGQDDSASSVSDAESSGAEEKAPMPERPMPERPMPERPMPERPMPEASMPSDAKKAGAKKAPAKNAPVKNAPVKKAPAKKAPAKKAPAKEAAPDPTPSDDHERVPSDDEEFDDEFTF